MRKGQAVMEFLMTYGWAILVVLAAIGALAYFGMLSPCKFSGTCVNQHLEFNKDTCLYTTGENTYNDECLQQHAEMKARDACSNEIVVDGKAQELLLEDINIIEGDNVVAVKITGIPEYVRHETAMGENDYRFVSGVECTTPVRACPRACDPKAQKGCFCYDITIRTFINETSLEKGNYTGG